MKFVDEATIEVIAGKGGNGAHSFAVKSSSQRVGQTVAMAAEVVAFLQSLIATSTR